MLGRLFSWLRLYVFGTRYFLLHTKDPIQGREFLSCKIDDVRSIRFFLNKKIMQKYRIWGLSHKTYAIEVYELRAYMDESVLLSNKKYKDLKLIAYASDLHTDDMNVIAGLLSDYYLEHISRVEEGKPDYVSI